jgi:hypothetical protein
MQVAEKDATCVMFVYICVVGDEGENKRTPYCWKEKKKRKQRSDVLSHINVKYCYDDIHSA